ncbi:hypothetical protein C5Y96_15365 [Blastopirellula marina]|uniref:Carboxypeptidase regulatory-like domain-containing protein n=2 Tax=Pirellulales TaxID=2691354 RepID=A0A2S8FAF3_9BACT|nr:hypothetical protein C5Y96_15365 [Blastopirellula marina]RCS50322.1 hypothetical protein DTL36_15375 [Bremerella cremea]
MEWTTRSRYVAFMVCVSAATLVFVGCGGPADPLNRQAIRGEITLGKKPLDKGSISFDPQDLTTGRSGGATILEGKLALDSQRGLPPGIYTVRVNSADSVTEAVGEPGESRLLPKERIPSQWNSKSEQTITVVDGEENNFQFAIP